jgi:aminoglycoside 6'-N-acetyltransferase
MDVEFRALVDEDLPLLHRWLNEPGVVRWWEGEDVSWDAVVREYGSASTEPVEHHIAVLGGENVAWIQCFAAADHPEEDEVVQWWRLGIDRTAGGIDYLVGAPERRGRGLGTSMIRAFVEQVAFPDHPGWTQVCASPLVANVASWRALRGAGFAHVADFDDPLGACRLMARPRGLATS